MDRGCDGEHHYVILQMPNEATDIPGLLKSMANLPRALPSLGPDYYLQKVRDLLRLWIQISAILLVSAWRAKPSPSLQKRALWVLEVCTFHPHLPGCWQQTQWVAPLGQQRFTCPRWPPDKGAPASVNVNDYQKIYCKFSYRFLTFCCCSINSQAGLVATEINFIYFIELAHGNEL